MSLKFQIFQIVVLIFSTIIHEYMHGWAANQLGDSTAKDEGRLTLNPIPHIDLFGSILLPLLLIISGSGFVFGWAKPVPFNPWNLRDKKYGPAKIALAGPAGNLFLALVFGLMLRFLPISQNMAELFVIIVLINLVLMIFNLIPIPPLDGSKVLLPFLPSSWQDKFYQFERYGLILIFVLLFIGFDFIMPIVNFLFSLITGVRLL
ncbi:MAG: site-2 protease family protein [Planctomycetes bacterium]|jgi:Zn-dependent protease|nr:site-2 protease family protein [Planctomycetota bacterium]